MITNYTELVSAIGDWLDRADLASRAGTFAQLAEARMNRLLDDPAMEATFSATASSAATSLPDDFGAMVSISTGNGDLTPVGPVEFAAFRNISGIPRYYVVQNGAISFAPSNSSAAITMVYRRRIPALSATNPTNWLLTLAPDAYLYGSLLAAESLLGEDDRIAGWKAMFDETLSELRSDGARRKYGAGTLAPRIRRS